MLNHITLQGRFVRDPELRRTQSGTAVCSFTLAVDRDIKDQNGNKQTDFIDHVAWRGHAEHISKYFRKGSAAVTSGRLELRDWTDKDGNKRRNAEVRVESIYFAESRKVAADQTGSAAGYSEPAYGGTPDFSELHDMDDGNLPF